MGQPLFFFGNTRTKLFALFAGQPTGAGRKVRSGNARADHILLVAVAILLEVAIVGAAAFASDTRGLLRASHPSICVFHTHR